MRERMLTKIEENKFRVEKISISFFEAFIGYTML